MTTSAQVRAAWAAKVWSHATITAITTKIHAYDVLSIADESEAHKSKLKYAQEINSIQYTVHKMRTFEMTGKEQQLFDVNITIYRSADITGANFNAIEDTAETINTLVSSELGSTWNGTVDYYRTEDRAIEITDSRLDDVPIWIGQFKYQGFKQDSI